MNKSRCVSPCHAVFTEYAPRSRPIQSKSCDVSMLLYVVPSRKSPFLVDGRPMVEECSADIDKLCILWKRRTSILGFNYQYLYFNYITLCMILPRNRLGLAAMTKIPLY